MREIIEMVQILQRMNTDTYLQCKYTLLAVSREHQGTHDFVKELFRITDSHRPLLIGIKEEV